MIQTSNFYSVDAGVIVPPLDVWVGQVQVRYNPHGRPTRIDDVFIGENSSDEFLVNLGEYRIWVDTPDSPGDGYRLVTGTPEVVGDIVLREDFWEPIPAQDQRQTLADDIRRQRVSYEQSQLTDDPLLQWDLDLNARQIQQSLSDLDQTEDANLALFDPDISTHPIADSLYAESLVKQETITLLKDGELKSVGDEGLLSAEERTEMIDRVAANAAVARGQGGSAQTPTIGVQRALVALANEMVSQATFKEVRFDWSGTDYFIPQVTLQSVPEGINTGMVYAMVYDQSNVYRSWMPFVEQDDGTWHTPSDVNYIAIAKTSSSTWRVAVAYQGTQPEYEITDRVYLVPPTISTSPIRWEGDQR